MRLILLIVSLSLLLAALPNARAEDGKPEQPQKEETLAIQRGDLQVVVETDGTLDPYRKKKIRVSPEEYAGPYTIAEIAPGGQMVEQGKVVLRLDTSTIERLIRGAQEGLDSARLRANTAREEYENLKNANRLKLERLAYDLTLGSRDQKVFEKYGEEQMLKSKELAVKSQEFYLSNQQEELSQLEKMYKDTQLAGETKEIVLERSRRSVSMIKEQLDLTRKAEKQNKEYDHPARKEALKLGLEQKTQDLDLYRVSVRLAEFQKGEDLKASDRAVRDAQERLTRLENDLKQMTWTAPFSGIMNYRGWDVDDKVMPNVVVAEILDLTQFDARFQLSLRDLQNVKVGDVAKLRINDLPEADIDAKIEEIALIPNVDDKGSVKYGVRARLNSSQNLRPGLKARIEIRGPKLEKVISLPRNVVMYEDGRTYCKLRKNDKIEKSEIVIGSGDKERVQVLKGLSEGDVVVVKEGKSK
jgi:HlyD family secretion protein